MRVTTKIGGPMRVVRHEPVLMYPGTPLEQVDKARVRVVLEGSSSGFNGDTATAWGLMRVEDAEGFPVGELVRMTLEVARFHTGSMLPYERREVPD